MKRTIIKIDENLCNGCGLCVDGCHEGALQLINGKATLVSELYCDGLGACIGDCPQDAIILEEREAEPYDESATMERLIPKGMEVVKAHLKHLRDHQQYGLVQQGVQVLQEKGIPVPSLDSQSEGSKSPFACPGSMERTFTVLPTPQNNEQSIKSTLQQWPVQLHLLSPTAAFLKGENLLLAADCSAFSVGDFHTLFLQGKRLAIACPKLDNSKEIYTEKLTAMIDLGGIDTLTVMIMEVPCCNGLFQMAKEARDAAKRNIPLKLIRIGLQGEVLSKEWVS